MFKIRLKLVTNLTQIMHITLSFYVELLVAYISSFILTSFKYFVYLFFFKVNSVFFFFRTEWQH